MQGRDKHILSPVWKGFFQQFQRNNILNFFLKQKYVKLSYQYWQWEAGNVKKKYINIVHLYLIPVDIDVHL